MQSSRLPGKVLMDIAGRSTLCRIVDRLRDCRLVDDIVVATSVGAADDAVEAWAKREGVHVHRGSENDVLARVVGAQRALQSDIVVEICGDMPLLDPQIVDLAVESFLANDCDVMTTVRVQSFPQGIDAEVFRLSALEEVERTVDDLAVREHVSLYFYEHPENYRIVHLLAPACWSRPEVRLQLDYPEDHEFIEAVYRRLEPTLGGTFGVGDVISLLQREPALTEINGHCEERTVR
jgi:spore coat polysaccharide biosynthesis protein SpsF